MDSACQSLVDWRKEVHLGKLPPANREELFDCLVKSNVVFAPNPSGTGWFATLRVVPGVAGFTPREVVLQKMAPRLGEPAGTGASIPQVDWRAPGSLARSQKSARKLGISASRPMQNSPRAVTPRAESTKAKLPQFGRENATTTRSRSRSSTTMLPHDSVTRQSLLVGAVSRPSPSLDHWEALGHLIERLSYRYPALCHLIPPMARMPDSAWTIETSRFIDGVYAECSARGGTQKKQGFANIVISYASKRYVAWDVLAQKCWDLMAALEFSRDTYHNATELFGSFLDETYDSADLEFFLKVRGVLRQEITSTSFASSTRSFARIDGKMALRIVQEVTEEQDLQRRIFLRIDEAIARQSRLRSGSRRKTTTVPEQQQECSMQQKRPHSEPFRPKQHLASNVTLEVDELLNIATKQFHMAAKNLDAGSTAFIVAGMVAGEVGHPALDQRQRDERLWPGQISPRYPESSCKSTPRSRPITSSTCTPRSTLNSTRTTSTPRWTPAAKGGLVKSGHSSGPEKEGFRGREASRTPPSSARSSAATPRSGAATPRCGRISRASLAMQGSRAIQAGAGGRILLQSATGDADWNLVSEIEQHRFPLCAGCSTPIETEPVFCHNGREFHPECFVCDVCQAPMVPSKNQLDTNKWYVCEKCRCLAQAHTDEAAETNMTQWSQEAERLAKEQAAAERAKQEAEEKAKQEAEEKAKQEAERVAQEQAAEKAKKEVEQKAQEEAERVAQEQGAEKAKQEAEEKAKQEAEHLAREQAAEKAKKEAEEKAKQEAERLAQEQAAAKAKKEAEEKAKQEVERLPQEQAAENARQEAEEKAKQEAERLAREQAAAKAKKEAEEKAKQEAERLAREQAAEKAKKEVEQKAQEEAERLAQEQAAAKAKQEAEEKAKQEAERLAREQAAEKARKDAEEKAKQEAERLKREQAAENAKKEAEEKAKKDAERLAREQAAEKAKKEAEEKAKQEAERLAREQAADRAKKEAEEKAMQKAKAAKQDVIANGDVLDCEVGPDVQKIGIGFTEKPPQRVFIKKISEGTWADAHTDAGLCAGLELLMINHKSVRSISSEDFTNQVKTRPLFLRFQRVPAKFATAGADVAKLGLKFVDVPPQPVFVKEVYADTWAAGAGIQNGDEILEVNNIAVDSTTKEDFQEAVRDRPLQLTFRRATATVTSVEASDGKVGPSSKGADDETGLGAGGGKEQSAIKAQNPESAVKVDKRAHFIEDEEKEVSGTMPSNSDSNTKRASYNEAGRRSSYANKKRAEKGAVLEEKVAKGEIKILEVTAGAKVEKIGMGFHSLPPGLVSINKVTDGSWAEEVGLRVNDEIFEVNGKMVSSLTADEFKDMVKARPAIFKVRRTAV